jgi:hypothetical protein
MNEMRGLHWAKVIGMIILIMCVPIESEAALPPPTDSPMVVEYPTTATLPRRYGLLCATRGEETRCMIVEVPYDWEIPTR